MSFSAISSTAWVADKIKDLTDVDKVDISGQHLLVVSRTLTPTFKAAVISKNVVEAADIQSLFEAYDEIDIVVNVPSQARWSRGAVRLCLDAGIAFGGMSALTSAIDKHIKNVRTYPGKELDFVEGGLRQYSRVSEFIRDDERSYRVERRGLPAIRVVVLNDYELTGEQVRAARHRYGTFDAILMNNPNGEATKTAVQIGRELKIAILHWRQFLGWLNQ